MPELKTSASGRAFIEAFEGLFLKTYDDGTGVLTIGYGHTSAAGPPSVKRGQTITHDQADEILANDLAAVEKDVARYIKVQLNQPQFDALVSFHFNTGALGKGSVATKINAKDYAGAMATLLQYNKGGGRVMAGLTRRRIAERQMFFSSVSSAMDLAATHISTPAPMTKRVDAPLIDKKTPSIATPSITNPTPGSVGAKVASWWSGIFGKKV
jgi:lysozyme